VQRRQRQREGRQLGGGPAGETARERQERKQYGDAREQRQQARRSRRQRVERDERPHQRRVQRPELAVGTWRSGARRVQHHPLGDQRAHRRVAVLVVGEREHRHAQHDGEADRNRGAA
jgi:hypothetical protein